MRASISLNLLSTTNFSALVVMTSSYLLIISQCVLKSSWKVLLSKAKFSILSTTYDFKSSTSSALGSLFNKASILSVYSTSTFKGNMPCIFSMSPYIFFIALFDFCNSKFVLSIYFCKLPCSLVHSRYLEVFS